MTRGLFVAAAFAALLATSSLRAQEDVAIASSWGLLGVWQVRCGAATSVGSPIYEYVARGGRVVLEREMGKEGGAETSAMSAFRIVAPDRIEYVVRFDKANPPVERRHVLLKTGDGRRFRNWSNHNVADDGATVVDGKFVHNGQATPWFNRCR